MIELKKPNGELRARAKLLYDLQEAKTYQAKEKWLNDMKVLYNTENPVIEEVDAEGNITYIQPSIGFDEWIEQEYEVTPETVDADGNIIHAVMAKVYEFTAPVTTEADLDAYLLSSLEYKKHQRDNMTVTTTTGKTFDADVRSRLNISDAIILGTEMNIFETQWKLADNTVQTVTMAELKEARLLAIQEFGRLTL